MTNLAQTALYQHHVDLGARMVDFAGWTMPVQYSSIIDEHHATRNAIGLFDVSHMGRYHFAGKDAGAFLDSLTTRRVVDTPVGSIRYSLLTKPDGGILDDVLVYHLQKPGKDPFFAMVVNAGNREKIASWINQHLNDTTSITFEDKTIETAMIAVQGPKALSIVQPMTDTKLQDLKNYTGTFTKLGDAPALVSRTGYTGEDGCEIIVNNDDASKIWSALVDAAQSLGGMPAGLGARDTLRLESAMPLYGHELSEQINPVEAGLKFAINLKDREFVGSDAIAKFSADDSLPVRVGLEFSGRRAAREGSKVVVDAQVVGEVTSGTFSPTLQRPIAMAYVARNVATPGLEVDVDIRGKKQPATIVKLPFYKRAN